MRITKHFVAGPPSGSCRIGHRAPSTVGLVAGLTFLSTLLPIVLTGCQDAGEPGPPVQVSDSAGVRIVETRVDADGAGVDLWSLAPDPSLVVGDASGTPGGELHQVTGAVRLADGGIAVANRGTGEIFVYDADGAHVRTLGGSGEGPGEFTRLGDLVALPGDTLAARNVFPDRVSFFDPEGHYVRTLSVGRAPDGEPDLPGPLRARLSDGSMVGWVEETHRDGFPAPFTVTLRVFRIGGPDLFELTTHGGRAAILGGVILSIRAPFAPTPAWAVTGDRVHYGDGSRWEVNVLDALEGRHVMRIRLDRPLRPVTAEDRERFREGSLGSMTGETRTEMARELDQLTFPETMPAWDRLLVEPDGHIWLREYFAPWEIEVRDERPWWVFAPDGALTAVVQVPTAFDPAYEVGPDGLLVRARDAFDVERIQIVPLRRSPG